MSCGKSGNAKSKVVPQKFKIHGTGCQARPRKFLGILRVFCDWASKFTPEKYRLKIPRHPANHFPLYVGHAALTRGGKSGLKADTPPS
jgi:hypothetical protein